MVDGKKMSKSLHNFYTLQDLKLSEKGLRALEFLYLNAHYRQEQNFTLEALKNAEKTIEGIDELLQRVQNANGKGTASIAGLILKARKAFEKALDDDLNSPKAWSVFFGLAKKINALIDAGKVSVENSKEIIAFLKEIDSVFSVFKFDFAVEIPSEVQKLLEERELARKSKDWKKADELRRQIQEKGLQVLDTPEGARVKKAE
jgi:cysteinyl-tRNA synthetase